VVARVLKVNLLLCRGQGRSFYEILEEAKEPPFPTPKKGILSHRHMARERDESLYSAKVYSKQQTY
jgi:hypothetical protein